MSIEDNFYVASGCKNLMSNVKNNLIKIKRSKVKILESEEIITIKHQYIVKLLLSPHFV